MNAEAAGGTCENSHLCQIRGRLNNSSFIMGVIDSGNVRLTSWDGEKPEQNKTVPMCPSYIVVNITDRHVDRPILIMACCNRDRGFVTAEDDRYKH
jgi:hypothetical protein